MKKTIAIPKLLIASLLLLSTICISLPQPASAARIDYSYGWSYTPKLTGQGFWPYDLRVTDEYTYIVGEYYATVDFGSGASTDEHTAAGGNSDAFVTKLDNNGNSIWTKTWGSTGADYASALALDSQNNLYIFGQFRNTVDFDTGAGTDEHTSEGAGRYLTKYNADGSYVWTKTFDGIRGEASISFDSEDNVYLVGSFSSTVDFDPGAGTDEHVSVGNNDSFLSKYNADGSYAWTKTWGGTSTDQAKVSVVDSNDNLFIAGTFSQTVDFDPGAGTDNHTSATVYGIHLTKYNSDGSYAWTKTWGGTGGERAQSVVVDSNGDIYTDGSFNGTVDFDPGAGTDERTSNGNLDIYLTKYNSDGSYAWTKTWGGTDSDYSNNFGLDSNGNLYMLGSYYGSSLDLNLLDGEDIKTRSGLFGGFLTKLTATHYQHSILSSGVKVTQVSTGSDASKDDEGIERGSNVPLRLSTDTGIPLADFTADMTTDRDWSGITGSSDTTSYQSVVSGLSTAPGVTGTHSLYVPKKDTDTAVHICPDAQTLEQVTTDCSNGQTYTEADDNVSIVDVNGTSYWLVSGLSGTGGVSVSGGLADTGTNTPILITIAVLIIASGGVGVVVARRQV